MNVGEYKRLNESQKAWLGWMLGGRRVFLKGKVDAEPNLQRLEWSYTTGWYDIRTQQLLNYLLGEFNKDIVAKNRWKIHNKWRVKLNDKI